MTVAEHYRRLAADFDATASALHDWNAPSPCEGWSAGDVVEHVAASEADIVTRVGLSIERTVDASSDPLGAWREVRDAMQAILDDSTKAALRYESLGAETTLAATIERFCCFDLIVHRWDLAASDKQSINIAADDLADANVFLDSMGQMFYDYGASAPALPVAAAASAQEMLLARAGRDAHWSPV